MNKDNSESRAYTYKKATHFRYSLRNTPWFGPRKKAYSALAAYTLENIHSEFEYLNFLENKYPDIYDKLEWVTFHTFKADQSYDKSLPIPPEGFEFRLAITNIEPFPKIRKKMYELRDQITSLTGWYPLVHGSRAGISRPSYAERLSNIYSRKQASNYGFILGKFIGVKNVSKDIERKNHDGTTSVKYGNAILLEGSKGSILLDTGFAVDLERIGRPRALFLSHIHGDHSGGFLKAAEFLNCFYILSEPTLAYLLYNNDLSPTKTNKLLENTYLVDNPSNELKTDGDWRSFQVFHAPGSYGIVLKDTSGKAIFYPGDICLKNGFLDKTEELYSFISNYRAESKTVLLDASMIKRDDYSIEVEDTPKEIIYELNEGINKRDVFFISSSIEASIYTFILVFYETRSKDENNQIIINDKLFSLTKRLIGPVLRRDIAHIDPFVEKTISRNIVNFIESHRVYPVSALGNFDKENRLIFFISKDDFTNPVIVERLKKSDAIIVGTEALRIDQELLNMTRQCRVVHRVASPDWSFHTSDEDLTNFITRLSSNNIKTILFHNGSDKLGKWIKKKKFDPNLVICLRHELTPF